MCCALKCILKFVMGIVNSLLIIMGLILAVIGGLLAWGLDSFMKIMYDLDKYLQTFLKAVGIEVDTKSIIDLLQTNSSTIGLIGFVAGIVLMALGIIGIIVMCCCSVRNILVVLLVIMIALTVGFIFVVIFYGSDYENKLIVPLEKELKKNILGKYVNLKSKEPQSVVVNIVQITVQCCGMSGYKDYNSVDTPNFKETYEDGGVKNAPFPKTCCAYDRTSMKFDPKDFPDCFNKNIKSNQDKGCWSLVRPELVKYLKYAFTTVGITIGVMIGVIIALIIMIYCANKIED